MTLINRIYRLSLILLCAISILSGFVEWRKLPFSIITGGILGLLNLRALSWGVSGITGSSKATGAMLFFSMLRLFLLFLVMIILLYLGVVNIFGLLTGFTVVFTVLLIEGAKEAKKSSR